MRTQKYLFRFKQFEVSHRLCAMKICTDSCLFGAWIEPKGASMIDVGGGCGLLSLMMMQRAALGSVCVAIELDAPACQEAAANFAGSIWADNLSTICVDIHDYQPAARFDLVFSNPPFFCDSLVPNQSGRRLAMHANKADLGLWLARLADLANPQTGRIAVLLPASAFDFALQILQAQGFGIARMAWVYHQQSKPAIRVMCEFDLITTKAYNCEHICIYEPSSEYTSDFIQYLKPYYLAL